MVVGVGFVPVFAISGLAGSRAWPLPQLLFWRLALVTPAGAARSGILASFARMVQAVAHELAASGTWPGSRIGRAAPVF
jgi:F0F1-type ATP synthase assembly protein I